MSDRKKKPQKPYVIIEPLKTSFITIRFRNPNNLFFGSLCLIVVVLSLWVSFYLSNSGLVSLTDFMQILILATVVTFSSGFRFKSMCLKKKSNNLRSEFDFSLLINNLKAHMSNRLSPVWRSWLRQYAPQVGTFIVDKSADIGVGIVILIVTKVLLHDV
jgi:hypothetical protein